MRKKVKHEFEIATEWCPYCGYEDFFSFNSYRSDCPNCGRKKALRSGPKIEKRPVRVSRETGHYNWLNSNETQFAYYFSNLPKELKSQFVLNEEIDISDEPLLVARELRDVISRYLLNPDKDKIIQVVEWLEQNEEEQRKLRLEAKLKTLEYKLAETLHHLGRL